MNREEIIAKMKERVFNANLQLPEWGLVQLTWGNASEVNRDLGVIVIKPSGVDYKQMTPDQMVVTDLDGKPLDADGYRPSSDLPTHVVLYKAFPGVNAVVHTHADTFYGPVPLTRHLTETEVAEAYEVNTGVVIADTFKERNLDPLAVPGVLVQGHGPFTWGPSIRKAIENSLVLDEVCHMALETEAINPDIQPLPQYVLDKHYFRKHGANAYYGQK